MTRIRIKLQTDFCLVALILGLAASAGSNAAEIDANFSAGVGVSDNIAMTPTDKIDETYGILGVALNLKENTARMDADIRANLNHMTYFDDTFDDELIGGVVALANFRLIEERLSWMVQDNFGQQKLDPFAPPRPGNRENINFFKTGPELVLPLSARNQLALNLLYSDIRYETRPFDHNKYSANLSLRRSTSESTNFSLNVFSERTEYKEEIFAPDYDRYEAFGRYYVSSARNTLSLDLGYTELHILEEKGDGILARLDWTREISPFSTFSLGAGTQYSDQGDIFGFNQGFNPDLTEPQNSSRLGIPFTNNHFNVGVSTERERTTIAFQAVWNQEDYEAVDALDRDYTRFNLDVRRELTGSTFVELGLRYRGAEFEGRDRKDDDFIGQATLGYEFGPALDVTLNYQYFRRSSDAAGAEFVENRVFVMFRYFPGWGRRP